MFYLFKQNLISDKEFGRDFVLLFLPNSHILPKSLLYNTPPTFYSEYTELLATKPKLTSIERKPLLLL